MLLPDFFGCGSPQGQRDLIVLSKDVRLSPFCCRSTMSAGGSQNRGRRPVAAPPYLGLISTITVLCHQIDIETRGSAACDGDDRPPAKRDVRGFRIGRIRNVVSCRSRITYGAAILNCALCSSAGAVLQLVSLGSRDPNQLWMQAAAAKSLVYVSP